MIPPKYSDLPHLFGAIDLDRNPAWAEEGGNMTLVRVPATLHQKLGVTRIYCNKAMAPHLSLALAPSWPAGSRIVSWDTAAASSPDTPGAGTLYPPTLGGWPST